MATKCIIRKELSMERKTFENEASPESSKIWIEPKHTEAELKVPVIYYLSTNGQLEHPHLMEVSISSSQGTLCLKDVIDRLSFLRGHGMANMYSWSTKRSYKNGFVWQDLSENDVIYPSSGHEYILKGTQLIEPSLSIRSYETISTPSSKSSTETNSSSTNADSPATIKGSRDHYRLYRANTFREFAGKAANASTQTEEEKGRQQKMEREQGEECEGNDARRFGENGRSLSFSASSFRSLEGSLEGYGSADIRNQKIENERPSGRMRASQVLMQLVRCRIVSTTEDL